jgi:hypothetical protein
MKMHLSPKRSFVKPVVEDFLPKKEGWGKFVMIFDLGGGVPPPKPLGFEMGIHMWGGHLLEFLNCHVGDEEAGKMTVNLPQKGKEINTKQDNMYKTSRKKMYEMG